MWSICRKFTENGVTTQVSIFRLSKAYCYKWHIIWHSRLSHHLECFLCLQSRFPPMYPCRQYLGRASHVGRSGLTCRPLALAWPALACWGLLGSESTDRTLSQPSLSSNLLSFFSSDSKKQMRRVVGYHLLSNSSLVCQRVLLKKKTLPYLFDQKGYRERRRNEDWTSIQWFTPKMPATAVLLAKAEAKTQSPRGWLASNHLSHVQLPPKHISKKVDLGVQQLKFNSDLPLGKGASQAAAFTTVLQHRSQERSAVTLFLLKISL